MIIVAADIDIFVSTLYHFSRWIYDNLEEMWMLCGQGSSSRADPLHDLVDVLNPITFDVLHAAYALTECDSTSKISTKQAA